MAKVALAILVGSAALLVGLRSARGWTFDSFTGLSLDGGIHGDIARDAVVGMGISKDNLDIIVKSLWKTDYDEVDITLSGNMVPNGKYRPEHHFDRNAGDTNEVSFKRGATFVQEQRAKVISALRAKDYSRAAREMGNGLHALQDFFSHSNFIDLSDEEMAATLAAMPKAADPPGNLMLTSYDRKTGKDLPGDSYGHEAKCKDNPKKNAVAQAPSRRPPDTKFQMAKKEAIKASRAFLDEIRHEVGEEVWKGLSK